MFLENYDGAGPSIMFIASPFLNGCTKNFWTIHREPIEIMATKSTVEVRPSFMPVDLVKAVQIRFGSSGDYHAVICKFARSAMDRTFASHSALFFYDPKVNYPGDPRKDLNLAPIILAFNAAGATDVAVDGRAKQSLPDKEINGSVQYKENVPNFGMDPGDSLKISWNNEGEREQRDVNLAILGVLLGMLGATIIEIVKLFLPRE